jgi:membrane fusion protein, multidrug efflux system
MKEYISKVVSFLRGQKEKTSNFLKKVKEVKAPIRLKSPTFKMPAGLKMPALSMPRAKMPSFNGHTLQIIVFFQSLLLIGGLSYAGWFYWTHIRQQEDTKKRDIPQSIVEALPVELGTFETFVSVVGTLKANESIVVRPEVEGKIKEVRFKSGDPVNKGDVLVVLEDAVYRALKKEAQAKVDLYQGKYTRAKILYERRSGTLKEKEEMEAQLAISKAELEKATSQLKKTVIRAPFSGIVGFKTISPGAYVRAGEDLVTLDELDPMSIDFRVAENMIDKVQAGKVVLVEVDGFPDNVFEATIDAVDSNIDPMGHSIRVRAQLTNKEELFKPGLFGKVKLLVSSHEDVIMVPESAVESRGNQEYVYRVEDGKARYTVVKTGGRNGEKVEVLSGLEPGQTVVVAGQMKIQDKWPVVAVPPYVLKRF